jgi:predicted RNA-binding Zn-ribbon protein involved in translation (DUF1610 family)
LVRTKWLTNTTVGHRTPVAERVRASLRQQQARAGSCTSATEAMLDSNDDAQERSGDDAQHFDCPNCGEAVQAITRRGPTDATANPCGCSLGSLRVQELTTEEVGA